MACREADARDVAAVADRSGQPRERVAAEVVDRAGPLRFLQRPLAKVDLATNQNLVRADTVQIARLLRLAGERHDLVPPTGKHVDRVPTPRSRCCPQFSKPPRPSM